MAIKQNSFQNSLCRGSSFANLLPTEVGTIEETTQKHQTTKARAMTETETPKERIKRKKKERTEALAKEEQIKAETPVIEPVADQEKREGVDVLEIYPSSKPKPKFVVQGHVSLKIHKLGMEVRNVPYSIDKHHKVKVQPPFRYHKFPDEPEKPDAYVESIKFDDKSIWKEAIEVVKFAVLEKHGDDLPKIEDPQEKRPS